MSQGKTMAQGNTMAKGYNGRGCTIAQGYRRVTDGLQKAPAQISILLVLAEYTNYLPAHH